jgi:hypothetical protein
MNVTAAVDWFRRYSPLFDSAGITYKFPAVEAYVVGVGGKSHAADRGHGAGRRSDGPKRRRVTEAQRVKYRAGAEGERARNQQETDKYRATEEHPAQCTPGKSQTSMWHLPDACAVWVFML